LNQKKVEGYNPEEVEKFVRWLRKTAITIGREVGATQGPRFLEFMNLRIRDYIETDFGIKRSIDKAEAKKNKEKRKKIRSDKKLATFHDPWHELEDKKEHKVFT